MRVCAYYLVIELTKAALQVESTRVGEFRKHLQMGNQLSVQKDNSHAEFTIMLLYYIQAVQTHWS